MLINIKITRNFFSKFVTKEEKRLNQICNNPDKFTGEFGELRAKLYRECADIAMEILRKLASSEKANRFISLIKSRNIYRTTKIRIADDFEWGQLEIFFVMGDEMDDVIKIESDIYERERYYNVISSEKDFEFESIDELVEYIANYPTDHTV